MPLNQFDISDWVTQPLGRIVQPNPRWVARGLEFLSSGQVGAAWAAGCTLVPVRTGVGPLSGKFVGAGGLTFSARDRQRFTLEAPITTFIVGTVVGTFASAQYPRFFSFESAFGGTARGGYEIGIGGNLGEGDADIGRVFAVVRGPGYTGNERLIKTTAVTTAGQRLFISHRMGPAIQELSVAGVGYANSTFAVPGANTDDGIVLGLDQASSFPRCEVVARFRSFLTDQELESLQKNPWQLFEPDRIWVSAAGGGVTGSLAVTLADATLSSASALSLAGTLSTTLGNATLSSAGSLAIAGALTSTLGSATLSSTGAVALTGALSSTLADATLASTGVLPITGSVTVTLEDATLSATGVLVANGTGSLTVTLENATLAAEGALAIVASLDSTLADATLSAAGALAITGSLDSTLEDATLVATGTLAVEDSGQLNVTLEDATLDSTGTLDLAGTLNATLADATLEAAGHVDIAGQLGVTLGECVLVATGASLDPISGQLTATLADATLVATGRGPGSINAATLGNNKRAEQRELEWANANAAALAITSLIISGAFDDL